METKSPNAIIASPEAGFREAVSEVLLRAGIQVLAQVRESLQLPVLVADFRVDVLLLDADFPGAAITQLCRIHRLSPRTGILVAADVLTGEYMEAALLRGVRGFVSKNSGGEKYVQAVHAIQRGKIWIGHTHLAHVLETAMQRAGPSGSWHASPGSPEKLSHRESEVVHLIAQGLTNKEIAKALGTSDKTVKAHLSHIFARLGVNRRAELALYSDYPPASTVN